MPDHRGAYGFRITGPDLLRGHLGTVPADWPELAVQNTIAPVPEGALAPRVRIGPHSARLRLAEADLIELTREPLTVRFTATRGLSAEAIAHPYLGLPAAIAAHWIGRVSFHGGAFIDGNRGWGLLGDREAGKSSLLARLAEEGCGVVSDDVLVIDGDRVFAGPRTIDLRHETHDAEDVGILGARRRWRVRPKAVPPAVRLGGFFKLEWGERLTARPLNVSERLQLFVGSAVLEPDRRLGPTFLELSALPVWTLSRPHTVDELPASMRAIRNAVAGAPS